FATWPTNRSPPLVNATTDGVVLFPSALGIATGAPPSTTDTQELVVPRSIPITLAIAPSVSLLRLFGGFHVLGYLDQSGTHDSVVQHIAAPQFGDNLIIRVIWRLLMDDRLVQHGVEFGPHRLDRLQPLLFQSTTQVPINQPQAVGPG